MELTRNLFRWTLALAVCTLHFLSAESLAEGKSLNIDGFEYGEIADFVITESNVNHIEDDISKPGNILFADGSSLRTTDGVTTATIAGRAAYPGYTESIGDRARFNFIAGFYQLNTTHVIVADKNNHCLRWVNRATGQTSRFSGRCRSAGYANGVASVAHFYYPSKIIKDKTNNNSLLVSHNQGSYEYIRSVAIDTGYVYIKASSGFNYPNGMVWDVNTSNLYVVNSHYVAKVNWTNKQTTRLAGSTSTGVINGNFSDALFYSPTEIIHLKDEFYILVDLKSLRLMNMKTQNVSQICVGGSCSLGSSFYSVASVNDTLYTGESKKIRRLTGRDCQAQGNVYLTPGEKTASVKINSFGHIAKLPIGEYQFQIPVRSCSGYILKVKKSSVVRRLVMRAEYNVTCNSLMLQNTFGKALLEPILKHKMVDYHDICRAECQISASVAPTYTCTSNVLRVMWPTDTAYPVNVEEVPSSLYNTLKERLVSSGKERAELVLLTQQKQFVDANMLSNGQYIEVALNMTCADEGQRYQVSTDTCI